MIDVKFYEVFKEEEIAIKKFLRPEIKVLFTAKTIQEEGEENPPAKVISIRTQSQIPLPWATHLKAVLSRSQGYDHLIQYQRKTKAQIPLGYLATYCSRAVAEQAIMAMMVLLRKTKRQIKSFSTFKRDDLTGRTIEKKKAIIIGVGNIGFQLIDLAQGLKMQVKGVDIDPRQAAVEYVSLEKGLRWADVIFVALPLTDVTNGMLNYQILSLVNAGTIFINVSRGEISPIADLERLLLEEKLGGVALDVYEKEKEIAEYLRKDKKQSIDKGIREKAERLLRLEKKDNVLFTPHNAFNTEEALYEKAKLSAKSIEAFLQTGKFLFPIKGE